MDEGFQARSADYDRKYLNVRQAIIEDVKDWVKVFSDCFTEGVVFMAYPDAEANPAAAILPWNRYTELLAIEQDHEKRMRDLEKTYAELHEKLSKGWIAGEALINDKT